MERLILSLIWLLVGFVIAFVLLIRDILQLEHKVEKVEKKISSVMYELDGMKEDMVTLNDRVSRILYHEDTEE